MQTTPHSAPEAALATGSSVPELAAPCPVLAAVKARAKALKKWRKHEYRRLSLSWCAGLHALGFSF